MALTSSDEDGADLMASFKKDAKRTTPTRSENQPSFSPSNFISDQSSGDDTSKPSQNARQIFKAVVVSPIRNKHEYIYWEPRDDVQSILREYTKRGETMYEIKLTGGASKQVSCSSSNSIWHKKAKMVANVKRPHTLVLRSLTIFYYLFT